MTVHLGGNLRLLHLVAASQKINLQHCTLPATATNFHNKTKTKQNQSKKSIWCWHLSCWGKIILFWEKRHWHHCPSCSFVLLGHKKLGHWHIWVQVECGNHLQKNQQWQWNKNQRLLEMFVRHQKIASFHRWWQLEGKSVTVLHIDRPQVSVAAVLPQHKETGH